MADGSGQLTAAGGAQGVQRKLAHGQALRAAAAAEGGPGADRSWRLALARAAQDVLSMPLDVPRLSLRTRSLAEVIELLPDHAFLALLEGPGDGLGLLALAGPVLSGLIEVQTLGRVLTHATLPRKPTRTDAVMVAGLIERALQGLDEALANEPDLAWAGGFRYASFLDDPRPLGLILEDQPYRVLSAEVSLASGAKAGEVILVLPAIGQGSRPVAGKPGATEPGARPTFGPAFRDQVLEVAGALQAILGRVAMPLSEVMALQPGQTLILTKATLGRVVLEGLDGRPVAEGRLGQQQGHRAVCLTASRDGSDGAGRTFGGASLAGQPAAVPGSAGIAPQQRTATMGAFAQNAVGAGHPAAQHATADMVHPPLSLSAIG